MTSDNPVLDTEALTKTDVLTSTGVIKSAKAVSGNKHSSKGASVKSLFAFDKTDAEFAPFSKHLVKAYYPGSKLIGIKSIKNLASNLSKYSTIDTLIIFTHSTSGSLLINNQIKTSQYVNTELAKANVTVTSRIVFEGCEIMQDPIDTCKMISSITGPSTKAEGYSYYTVTQIVSFDFTGQNDPNIVQSQYNNFDNKYWLPGLPASNDAIGKKFSHGRRWFRDILDKTAPEGKNFRRIESLTSLGRIYVNNYQDAVGVKQKYSAPVISGDKIIVSNVSNIANAKP